MEIKIRNKQLSIPIIQGGMGVGISLSKLAGSVARNGGMGVLSSAHPGYRCHDFLRDSVNVNMREMKNEVIKAKEIAKGIGMIAVNVMVAIRDYEKMILSAIRGGCDAIISGAGLPLKLPEYVKGKDIAIAPIVSSKKALALILRQWDKKYTRTADFVVVEGSKAGGHLGFHKEDLLNDTTDSLDTILEAVLEIVKEYENKYQQAIPVFVAGGISTGKEIKHYIDLGASGVQIATRFITTEECDASKEYKEKYCNIKKEDIQLVDSPVGMPGRALNSSLIKRLANGEKIPIKHCFHCLLPCDPKTTSYCISKALIEAAKGNEEEGLFFCGSEGYRHNKITTVKEVIEELMNECGEEV